MKLFRLDAVFVVVFAALVVCANLALPVVAQERGEKPLVVAQSERPKTLFELLFGGDSNKQDSQRNSSGSRQRTQSQTPAAALPPAKEVVEKSETATRLAVFGDSLAIDAAKALERFYADDPDLVVVDQGVGSTGFVRDDYFDWNDAIGKQIDEDSFDIAVIVIGINDRQPIEVDGESYEPLSEEWKQAYQGRLGEFLSQLRNAGKPVVWVGLPPMKAPTYSAALQQISAIHKLAAFSGGAEFVDIYERFVDENGDYTVWGPDLNGQTAQMRKSDGIHYTSLGADKLAFYINQAVKLFYRGGTVSVAVSDPLAGTEAAAMQRAPFQGLGQIRLLEVAGAVTPLSRSSIKADGLVVGSPQSSGADFALEDMVLAPVGRVDSFGRGVSSSDQNE